MIKSGDLEVTASFGFWPRDEEISSSGYKPPRQERGLKITVVNRSSEDLIWCCLDIGVHHDATIVNHWPGDSDGPSRNIVWTYRGTEVLRYATNRVAAGKVKTIYEANRSVHREKSVAKDWRVLRVYGETQSGKFVFKLADPLSPPFRLDRSEESTWCFIATAAFESQDHPEVVELRRVRDELLKPTRAGRAFIKFYYRHSPRIAAWMATRPRIKRATRAVLTPLARSTRALSTMRREGWRSLFQNKL